MPGDKKGKDKDKNPYFRINSKGGIQPTGPDDSPNQPEAEPTELQDSEKDEASYQKEPKAENTELPEDPILDIDEDEEVSGFTASIVLNSPLDIAKKRPAKPENTGSLSRPKTSTESRQLMDDLKPAVENINQLHKGEGITPDQIEILKKYIALKEMEAKDLKEQLRLYQAQWKNIRQTNEALSTQNRELLEEVENHRSMEEQLKAELNALAAKHQGELVLAKNDFEDQLKRSGNFQDQMQDLLRQKDVWKEKVREDLKRIKLKERELENKYELLKRDTQTLLDSKDRHVLELKKKNDALELELESLEERLRSGNVVFDAIESKKRRLVETLKLAISLLEEIDEVQDSDEKRKLG